MFPTTQKAGKYDHKHFLTSDFPAFVRSRYWEELVLRWIKIGLAFPHVVDQNWIGENIINRHFAGYSGL